MPTVAAVIIGNELLTGKFRDENGPWLVDRLRALGADLRRVATIEDDVAAIADEVARCAEACDLVVTSGGVGPTHDDVTLEGVAAAFGEPMEVRDELVELLRRWDLPLDEANLRMATVPRGTEVLFERSHAFPVLRVHGVFVLPGPPRLFREKFDAVADRFAGVAVLTARVLTDEPESAIALRLTEAAARHPDVAIGSYPRWGEGPHRVVLTLECRDAGALSRAFDDLRAAVRVVGVEPPR